MRIITRLHLVALSIIGVLAVMVTPGRAGAQTLVQWGDTSLNQAVNAPAAAGPYTAISTGIRHSLALRADGSLVQWGDTNLNQANGAPPSAGPYIAIKAGYSHNLALRSDGTLVQWGRTAEGQANNAPAPSERFVALAAGSAHNLALRSDGSLVQWGSTSSGQANNAPPAAGPYIAIAAGKDYSLALRADGSLVQWGNTTTGQATNAPPAAGPYIAIDARDVHNLALRADGSLVQWGDTSQGQADNSPPATGPYTAIAAGQYYSLALRADGSLVQWGYAGFNAANNPPQSAGPYSAIAAGYSHNIALTGAPVWPRWNVSFTYQGRLSGQTGPVDMNFTLFNAATGGTQVGATSGVIALTPDAQGVFTAQVRPGAIDASRPLWLEVSVAASGSGTFTTLTPRQAVSSAPSATYASAAGFATTASSAPWSGLTGVPSNIANPFNPWVGNVTTISYNGLGVGIGTTTPTAGLHVAQAANVVCNMEGSSVFGTWFNIQNTSGGRFWRMISTGSGNSEGAGNLLIGHGTSATSQNNVMTLQSASGNVGIGTVTPTQRLTVAGNVLANNVAVPSSGRFKHNVAPMSDALNKLLKLEGVTFDWNPDFAKERPGREHDIGFVAEDVAKVFPEVVFYDAEGKVTGMDYSRLTAVAVAAIKQQQAKFDAELARRDAENAELRARLAAIEAALAKFNQAKP